jgi:hypothetical protein
MEKSHVGMAHHVCPVCGIKHDPLVLLNRHLRQTLTADEFAGWAMCPEHKKLQDESYIALIEVTNEPKDFGSANRTGMMAHVKSEAFTRLFKQPAPDKGIAFVQVGVIAKLQELTTMSPKDPT